ncbi:MAG: glycosyltransferase [Cytophagales bacterium]|nr:MAG: glycosyltransferase [Cytophagales bacterium]TAF60116.1 MAG: glycosyltransferase [Cytophagales bacterium]
MLICTLILMMCPKTMTKPLITVITPSYNQAEYLEATIVSVLNQGYDNLEYMIFDGGSTDSSVEIIKRYAPRLTYWATEKDRGQSHAINKGFSRATGDIITWLNSDDQLTENALKTVSDAFISNPELGLVHGEALLFGQGVHTHTTQYKREDAAARQLAGLPFAQPAAFFSRKAFLKSGHLDENLHYGMDYAFFLPMFLSFPTAYLPHTLAKYLYHPASKTMSSQALFGQDYAAIFSKLLRSVLLPEAQDLIKSWKEWGFYVDGNSFFELEKPLDKQTLQLAACYNLYFQMIFNYQGLNLEKVQQITAYIKKLEPAFWNQQAEIRSIYWRSRYLPKWLMNWQRNRKNVI